MRTVSCEDFLLESIFPVACSGSFIHTFSLAASKKLGKTVKKSEYEGKRMRVDQVKRSTNASSSSSSPSLVFTEKIRVGRDYQAVCPELVPPIERKPETVNDKALLVWSPTKEITDTKCESQGGVGIVACSGWVCDGDRGRKKKSNRDEYDELFCLSSRVRFSASRFAATRTAIVP